MFNHLTYWLLQWTASDSSIWVEPDGLDDVHAKLSKLGDYAPRYSKMSINRAEAKHWGRISWYVLYINLPTGAQSPLMMLHDQLAVNYSVWADAEGSGGEETLLLWRRRVAEVEVMQEAISVLESEVVFLLWVQLFMMTSFILPT